MSVQGINSSANVSALRLVQPAQPVPQSAPVKPAQPVRRDVTDSYDFQSIREAQLPRMAYTQAHQRLDKLRDLIAAKTDVPIHFDSPAPTPGSSATRSANPYAAGYLKFPVNAAERNAAATDTQNL